MSDLIGGIWNGLGDVARDPTGFLTEKVDNLGDVARGGGDFIGGLWNGLGDAGRGIAPTLGGIWNGLGQLAIGLGDAVVGSDKNNSLLGLTQAFNPINQLSSITGLSPKIIFLVLAVVGLIVGLVILKMYI